MRTLNVKFGSGLFTAQVPSEATQTPSEHYRELLELGRFVVDCGFDKTLMSEHHFVDNGYHSGVFLFCAALAAR